MPDETLIGTVRVVIFRNDNNDYTIVKIYPGDQIPDYIDDDDLLTVVGSMPPVQRDSIIEAAGKWVENEKYGRQFQASRVRVQDAKPVLMPLAFMKEAVSEDAVTVTGTVERITFYNPENSWCVAKIVPDSRVPGDAIATDGTMAAVGTMPELIEGETVRLTGKWVEDSRFGMQLRAEQTVPIAPQNKRGVVRYLADTVYGVGERTAERIYSYFGDETIEILDADPKRIYEVPDLKKTVADNVMEAWTSERQLRQVMIYLGEYGVSNLMARRIFDEYGVESLNIVQNDPYQLADAVQSIGFHRADRIAQRMGLEPDSPQRMRAGLFYALRQMSNEGHCFSPVNHLIETACDLLEISLDNQHDLAEILKKEIDDRRLVYQENGRREFAGCRRKI